MLLQNLKQWTHWSNSNPPVPLNLHLMGNSLSPHRRMLHNPTQRHAMAVNLASIETDGSQPSPALSPPDRRQLGSALGPGEEGANKGG